MLSPLTGFFANVLKSLQTPEGPAIFFTSFLVSGLIALPLLWLFMEPKVVRVGVYVGRFQPLTYAHLASIMHFFEKYDEFIILIGSHGLPEFNQDNGKPVNPKNPYNTAIRRQMIQEAVRDYMIENNMDLSLLKKLSIRGIHDSNHKFGYAPDKCNFSAWNSDFNTIVSKVLESKYPTKYFQTWDSFDSHFDVYLCGCGKDAATQDYLKKIRLGCEATDDKKEIVGVNFLGHNYLLEDFIAPICISWNSTQTIDATTIRALITSINAGEHNQMTELEKWVPASTIRVLQEHEKLINID